MGGLETCAERPRVNKYTWDTVTLVWKLLHPVVGVKKQCSSHEGMIQRQKDAVFALGIEFSIKHSLFALLVQHSEWILNYLVRNDFLVELDNRVIKISPYESHTGNLAPRSTSLRIRILVGRRDDKLARFQQAWFSRFDRRLR